MVDCQDTKLRKSLKIYNVNSTLKYNSVRISLKIGKSCESALAILMAFLPHSRAGSNGRAFPLRSIPPLAAFIPLAPRPKQCRRGRFSHFVRALAYPLLHLLSVRSAARNSSATGPPIQTPWVARVFTQACYACGPSSRALARRGDMLLTILPAALLCGSVRSGVLRI